MSGGVQTEIDRSYLSPEIRARAISYLTDTGNTDLLPILGLAPDPVALERTAAKAKADLTHARTPKRDAVPTRAKDRSAAAGQMCPACMRRTQADGHCRRAGCGGAS